METSNNGSVELCTWVDLSLADVRQLLKCCSDREGLKHELAQKLGLECAGEDIPAEKLKQTSIEADLFTYAFLFGIRENYSPAQLSTLITIVKRLHTLCVSTLFDNHSEAVCYFQRLVIQHSINRPPFSIEIFNPREVKMLNEYILSTYFKHYKLYKYVFTRKVHLNISLAYAGDQVEKESELKDGPAIIQESPEEQQDKDSELSHCTLMLDCPSNVIRWQRVRV